tara:strand:+ start:775 stop:1095 length:321 start_codon:yes stop_codon:yes gene_type:complete
MMTILTITLSVLCLGSLFYNRRLKNKLIDLEGKINDIAAFCHQQTDINHAVVGKLLQLEEDLSFAQEITREYPVEESDDSCAGFGQHKNTKFPGTKEMSVEDHKWS